MTAARNVLDDLGEKRNSCPLMKRRPNKVKHALYDAEDLIDEIRTTALQQRLYDAGVHSARGADSLDSFYEETESRFERTNKIFKGIKELINVSGPMASLETQQPLSSSRVPVTSLDRAAVNINSRVVALIGVPGIGKTTLAQSIFNDPKAGETFDFRTWISVSEVFDISQIITSILHLLPMPSSAYNTYDTSADAFTTNLEFSQWCLRQRMIGKKFLIVLDDVWEENIDANWNALHVSLGSAATGSTVMVTTHNKDTARRFHPIFTLELHKLSDDDCWSLIKERAVADPHAVLDESLEEIGRRIAAKCRGLPLAAKALGSLLASASDARKWENIENSRIWDLPPCRKQILPALLLSYNFLPPHLRRCFAYCSLFPKNYQFQKQKLLMLWMAEGLMEPTTGYYRGTEDYFDMLVAKSLFQESNSNKHFFTMHDLVHELAVYAAAEFSFMLDANIPPAISGSLRHFSYNESQYKMAEKFGSSACAARLRTFLPVSSSNKHCSNLRIPCDVLQSPIPCDVLQSLVQSFNCLRVLGLRRLNITHIPDLIGDLKHLGTLLLSHCKRLRFLPRLMSNLIQMHHLDIRGTDTFEKMSEGGQALRELGGFANLKGHLRICGLENVVAEADAKAAKLIEKKHLDELVLEDRLDNYFARNPRHWKQHESIYEGLRPHSSLRRLTTLEFLQLKRCIHCIKLPYLGKLPFLKNLIIEHFGRVETVGPEFYGEHPSTPVRSFLSLKIPKVKSMRHWETWITHEADAIPFPSLEELHVEHCEKLRGGFPLEFPFLKVLNIKSCRELCGSLPQSSPLLPSLEELHVEDCEKLKGGFPLESPSLKVVLRGLAELPNLTSLSLCWEVEKILKLGEIVESHDSIANIETALPCLTSLQSLKFGCDSYEPCARIDPFIHEPLSISSLYLSTSSLHFQAESCLPLSTFPGGGLWADNLTTLRISNCNGLISLSKTLPDCFPSLQCLSISYCPLFESFAEDGLPLNLQTLRISSCKNLRHLPVMSRYMSLQLLDINGCSRFEVFPAGALPPNLRKPKISSCTMLRSLPDNFLKALLCLEFLHISHCPKLETLPPGGFPPYLEILHLVGCQELLSYVDWQLDGLIFLKELVIEPFRHSLGPWWAYDYCIHAFWTGASRSTEYYIDQLQRLTYLQILDIQSCHTVALATFVDGLPGSLQRLVIKDCVSLSLRSRVNESNTFLKYHQPRIKIDLRSLHREPSTTVHTKGVSLYTFIVPVPTSRGMGVTRAQDSSGSSIDLSDDNQKFALLLPGKVAAALEAAEKQFVHNANGAGARNKREKVLKSMFWFLNRGSIDHCLNLNSFLPATVLFLSFFFLVEECQMVLPSI
ncbi:hypothetical protein Cgig2_034031 [Carnegiea gigantea]|uniref:NB-ARC domain-containing protein n=1 Tax=Carnegiea gigantea TaxID=171969 RepID=A0A9Q1GS99_9CARY|nr:hypothetical protein Cgig2_034031 [Carnegiea gigantea]